MMWPGYLAEQRPAAELPHPRLVDHVVHRFAHGARRRTVGSRGSSRRTARRPTGPRAAGTDGARIGRVLLHLLGRAGRRRTRMSILAASTCSERSSDDAPDRRLDASPGRRDAVRPSPRTPTKGYARGRGTGPAGSPRRSPAPSAGTEKSSCSDCPPPCTGRSPPGSVRSSGRAPLPRPSRACASAGFGGIGAAAGIASRYPRSPVGSVSVTRERVAVGGRQARDSSRRRRRRRRRSPRSPE